ncbi:ABC transporter ATP-binding protein [Acinetobacter zhairhuonensis]|uniref:ABC transporter ATP-binding protein n=1 Tax=Acinetobacter sp. A7.4 TaxID=2919921 RepID=UPI001F4F629E|nr:ABC transporter ATP-binding protein [Acinetobacter sp. A7.4]MCJ8161414.1 ABC transporter ATP-binding protein/permease [Acinetobacter sp. A7.4]
MSFISILRNLWEIFTPLDKRKFIIVLIFTVIMACIETAGVLSIMPFLAVISNPEIINTNKTIHNFYMTFKSNNFKEFVIQLGVMSMAVVLLSSGFKVINQYVLSRFLSLQRHYFSTRLLKIYLMQDYDFFLQKNSSELSKNILSEVDQLVNNVIQPILQIISYGLVLFAMVLVIFIYHPIMAIGVVCSLSIIYTIIFINIRKLLERIGREFQYANKERYRVCQEVLSGIKDVKINNAIKNYLQYFNNQSRVYAKNLATNNTVSQVPLYIVETIGYCSLIVLAITLVMLSNKIEIVLPVLGLYGFAAYRMLPAAQNIYRAVAKMKFVSIVFEKIHNDLRLKVVDEDVLEDKDSNKLVNFKECIELRNVHYAYPSSLDKPVLDRFNLIIKKAMSIGVVGRSGSGKSTLMDILLGLLKPQSGELLIDGVEINENNVSDWQNKIGYVPQFIYLSDSSVEENIAFGVEKNQIDKQAVIKAAKIANIDDFINEELIDGYETKIGERGVRLSGGQRQRIGIARALYKNPDVIFMDEATSALDKETELSVYMDILKYTGEKTIIIITHSENISEFCDEIIKL